MRVNGYPVKDAVGYKGNEIEISGLFTLISKFLKEYVEEAKLKFFPHSKIRYYSDIRVLWQVLKSTENLFEPSVVADIGGEMTSVFFIGGVPGGTTQAFLPEAIEHGKAFAFGVRTLERRLAAYLKTDFLDAESVFKKYTANTLDEATKIKVSKILDSAMDDWWSSFKESIADFKGTDCGVFADVIKNNFKKYFDLDVSPHNLQAEVFKDSFVSMDMLSGGSDVVLVSLILYY
jgi:cell division ATPase FtsA